jgi:hypothetical protein
VLLHMSRSLINLYPLNLETKDIIDRLKFLSATGCDISTELEFIASRFYDFLCRYAVLKTLPLSLICALIGCESRRSDSEEKFYNFIRECTKRTGKYCRLELSMLEYCSMHELNNFFNI